MGEIAVVGTGYIGSVIALHLAADGHSVVAVDTDPAVEDKAAWFNRYTDLTSYASSDVLNRIETTTDYDAISGDTAIVCVDTPVDADQKVDTDNLLAACERLGQKLAPGDNVIVKSTIPPGTSEEQLIPRLEDASGMESGSDFAYCYAPEFLRGGSGVEDLRSPGKVVIAGHEPAVARYRDLFPTDGPVFETGIREAEAVKYFDNAFHALKISFANEVGRIGAAAGFDSEQVMDILQSDQKLNTSAQYLDPGSGFGGPCLHKDTTTLNGTTERLGVETPILSSIQNSNDAHTSWVVDMLPVEQTDTVGIIGVTYKSGFNSTTNSPALAAADAFEERGMDVMLYDPSTESDYIHNRPEPVIEQADALIIFHVHDMERERITEQFNGPVLDLDAFKQDIS